MYFDIITLSHIFLGPFLLKYGCNLCIYIGRGYVFLLLVYVIVVYVLSMYS